jgi:hypothetical protein
MVELTDLFEALPELVVIAEPTADLLNLLAAQAELPGAAARADGQNPQRVLAAAGADRAAECMAYGALDQEAA